MAFVKSANISVFPTTRRGVYQRSARLLSEQSLVSIINQLVDVPAFVITNTYGNSSGLEFNIGGYYFNVDSTGMSDILSALGNPTDVWASITLDTITTQQGNEFIELEGQDNGDSPSLYEGVTFSDSQPADALRLKILTKGTGGTYSVPRDSQIRFNADQVFGDITVDGGIIS